MCGNRNRIIPTLVAIATSGVCSVFAQQSVQEPPPTQDDPIRFTATIVRGTRTAGTLDIVIERWSTDAERQALIALVGKTAANPNSQEPLVEALQGIGPRAGYIRRRSGCRDDQTLAWNIKYAYAHLLPDGTGQIVVVTDKPIGVLAAYSQMMSLDYPFSLVEMRFPVGQRGEGKLLSQTVISVEDGRLQLDLYGGQATRLMNITATKRTGTS